MNGGKFFNNAGDPSGMNSIPNNMGGGQGGFIGVEAAKNGDFSAVSKPVQSTPTMQSVAPQGQMQSAAQMNPMNTQGIGVQQPIMQPVQKAAPTMQPVAPAQPVMQPVQPVQQTVMQPVQQMAQPQMMSSQPMAQQPMMQPTQPMAQPVMNQVQPMTAPQQPMQVSPVNQKPSVSPIQNGVIQPSIQANPMDVASVPTTPQQQPIVMTSGGGEPTFNNSLNGISPLDVPVAPPVNNDLKMKTKLKFDFKKLILIIVALLVVAAVVLVLCCYKVVSCKGEEKVYEATVSAEAKAYFWFGKINKIVTTKTIDMKGLNKEEKEAITNLYKEQEDSKNEDIQFKGDKIIITTTTKPENKEEADVSEDDFIDAFETYEFVCK